ncbi:hypothetical protein VitviT2T_015582 [Vitis vinifera]|uniref:Wall-associated receptor kinase galacturonan-binding domain-containing protein n=1 Tax=Vitis vinifera TaxID=29760 RepID=A0ABY9CR04_VITVI|nr:hypothetical protein VitviT2T_015582 [Vitis vinifera]
MVMQMIQVLAFTILISIISLLFSLKETAASMAKPGCPETCGNVSIVYPFGIGKGCYLDKRFEITCNNSSLPHPLFHVDEENEAEVLYMSLEYMRIRDWASPDCYANYTSEGQSYAQFPVAPMEPFSYSHTENKFIGIGCDIFAYIGYSNTTNSTNKSYISGCVSVCNGQGWSWLDTNYSCSGIGCCQNTFPEDLSIFEIRIGNMSTWADGGDWPSNQCSLVLIAENNFSEFHQFDVSFSNVNKTYFYPSVLNWAIGNKSCHEAQKRGDYACGSNSRCVNSKKGSGYTCQCNSGYRGNPYLPDGCGDKVIVNEGQEKEILAVAKIAKRCLKLSGKKRPAMKEIAADLHQLRRTMKQPSLQQTCQDNCPVSGRYSFSSASTSAVTEEYALQG